MQKNLKGKKIEDEDIIYLLNLKQDEIDANLLKELFAYKKNNPARFNANDYFTLEKGKLRNSENILTSVGRYIFNLFIFSNSKYESYFSYINESLDQDQIDNICEKMSNLLLDNKIETTDFSEFINKVTWLGFTISKYMNSSLTTDIIIPNEVMKQRKKELIEKYQKEINSGDITKITEIENELLEISKQELKDSADMDIYNCKAKGKFSNNYKQSSIMRGVIKSLADPTKILVSTASLIEGIPPDELYAYADILTQASYSRAVGTRDGGLISSSL